MNPFEAKTRKELSRLDQEIRHLNKNIPEWAKETEKPQYTAEDVGADPKGTAEDKVAQHNQSTDSHEDIRKDISDIKNTIMDYQVLSPQAYKDLEEKAEGRFYFVYEESET